MKSEICKCGHEENEHDSIDSHCFGDTNSSGKRMVLCKCQKFEPKEEICKNCARTEEQHKRDTKDSNNLCKKFENHSPGKTEFQSDVPVDTINRNETGTQTLSDKVEQVVIFGNSFKVYLPEDVKESIKKLKEEFKTFKKVIKAIDKIFGEDLVK